MQHFFSALRVSGAQRQHAHVVVRVALRVVRNARECFDDVGLVVFHGDDHAIDVQQIAYDINAFQYGLCVFDRLAVVGGDVRFTLGRVDDERVDALALRHVELHVRWETGAAQAHKAGLPQRAAQAFGGIHLRRLHIGRNAHFAVGLNHHGIRALAARQRHLRDGGHLAGNACMDRRADIGVAVADFLAHIHRVPDLDKRPAGRTHMLLHGDRDLIRAGQHSRLQLRRVFPVGNRRTAVGAERFLRK